MTTSPDRAGLLREAAQDILEAWNADGEADLDPLMDALERALAATGDSGGRLERCPWCDGTGRVVEDARLPYDKADHAAREGVPE